MGLGQTFNLNKEEKKRKLLRRGNLLSTSRVILSYLSKPRVQSHGWMIGILSEIQIRRSPELLFYDKSLLQEFEPSSQEFVFDLQEIPLSNIHLEGLVDDDEPWVRLNILPPPVSMSNDA